MVETAGSTPLSPQTPLSPTNPTNPFPKLGNKMGKWLGKFSVPKRGARRGRGGESAIFAGGSFSSLRPLLPRKGDQRDPSGDLGKNRGEDDGR
jgi:hypothetical protein